MRKELVLFSMWAAFSCLLTACGAARTPPPVSEVSAPVARAETNAAAPVEVLRYRVSYVFQDSEVFTSTTEQTYKILTPQGVTNWGFTGAGYAPWYMARPELSATVTAPDGTRTALNPATIAESAAYAESPTVYSDYRVLRAPLPLVSVGATVSEKQILKYTKAFFPGGVTENIVFQTQVPRQEVEVVVDLPSDVAFRYELRDAKVKVVETREGARRHVVFRGGPYAALDPIESLTPTDVPTWPNVVFSTGTSWQALATSYYELIKPKLVLDKAPATLKSLIDNKDTRKTKAEKLLRWVKSKVRYTGIEFGLSAIVPSTPTETLSRGYGDCKDQAALLASLLQAAGLPARVALLRVGTWEDVRETLPALNVFDHAIVVVTGDDPLWIDPTSDHSWAGDLPPADQNRLALVIDANTQALTRTPASPASANTYREVRDVFFANYGPGRAKEATSAGGNVEYALRQNFSGSRSDAKESLGKYVLNTYNSDALGAFNYPDATDFTRPFRVEIEAERAKIAYTALDDAEVVLSSTALFSWLPSAIHGTELRKAELVLLSPYQAEVLYRLHPPEGFVLERLPEVPRVALGPGTLERSVKLGANNVVEASFKFSLTKPRLTPVEVQAFRDGVAALDKETALRVRFLSDGKKRLAERDAPGGIKALRQWVKAKPRDAFHRMRWAVALHELGFSAAARVEARAAVALEPGNSKLWTHLGDILTCDELGRSLHAGYDRQGALDAYRRAAALDPDALATKLQIGVILEHDASGTRYVDRSELDKAVEQYDSLDADKVKEHANGTYANNVLFALTWAERYSDVRARVQKLSREQVPAGVAIVAASVEGGINGGLAEALRLNLNNEALSEALATAGEILVLQRNYKLGAALVEAAGAGAKDPVSIQQRARFLKGLKPIDVPKMSSAKPFDVVLKAQALYGTTRNVSEKTQRQLLSERATNPSGKSALEAALKDFYSTKLSSEAARQRYADILVAATQANTEGSDALGYRIKVRFEISGKITNYETFVVREQGTYKLRAFGHQVGELGAEALHWAEKGNLARAKQWLSWARDLAVSPGGDDQLRVEPFPTLWQEGKGNVLWAAAALAAQGAHASRAIPVLEAAKAEVKDARQLAALDHALAHAFGQTEQYPRRLEAAQRLVTAYPDSEIAQGIELETLWRLERFKEYKQQLDKALKKKPDDPLLLDRLYGLHYRLDLPAARRFGDKLISTGKALDSLYNNQAWLSLFLDEIRDQDLGYALKAAQLSGSSAVSLHTLATLYASLGRTEEARQMLQKVLEARPDTNPASVDWFVIGRLADQLGLADAARTAYARVERPAVETPTSTYKLAQKRLAKLNKQ